MSSHAQTDSMQLYQMRALMRQAGLTESLTPLRMGRYAGERRLPVTDMGAHSKRWRDQFNRGYTLGLLDYRAAT